MKNGEAPAGRASIVVCTYNRAEYLARCLDCLVRQDYADFEVVVVDNNSTDDTATVARRYPVRYLREERQGVSYARNRGLDESAGEYVGYVDDDEELRPDWLANMVAGFAIDEKVAGASGPVIPRYEVEPPGWLPRSYWEWGDRRDIDSPGPPYLFDRVFGTGNSMFRRRLLHGLRFRTDLGRSGPSLLSGEDTELVGRLLAAGYRTVFVPRAPVFHTITRDRISLGWLMRRALAEGMTEYACRGARVLPRRIPRLLIDVARALAGLASFNRRYRAEKIVRCAQTLGIFYGCFRRLCRPRAG